MLASTLPILQNEQDISAMLSLQTARSDRSVGVGRLEDLGNKLKKVVLCGYDFHVADTRKMLLGSIGYEVRLASNTDEAVQCLVSVPIEILILCHSVTSDSAERLLSVVRVLKPSLKVLLLTTGRPTAHQHLGDGLHDTCDGPAKFLAKVRSLAKMGIHTH